ncbi:MAG: tRNA (guanosine(37)-N1)-methyltransferase TrmD [Eubacteriales bacterium]|nr:tRNA (guanosine(37)-N1)-methyltransferase TrmD [Eubacteriales bacterium]
MNYHVLTLFPEMIEQGLHTSVTGRALASGLIRLCAVNIRDYSKNKHKHVDDYPYGGGAGMVMQPEPIFDAYQDVVKSMERPPRVVYVTPQGKVFRQSMAEELAKEENLVFLCGHYEGVDERVLEELVTDYISIGDYVLTGGELPAMVMIDAISRLIPGVLNNKESAEFETFHDNLLEYPQYTRPVEYHGKKVPDVLLSGHHGNVEQWRREQSLKRTLERRPELLENAVLSPQDDAFLEKLKLEKSDDFHCHDIHKKYD